MTNNKKTVEKAVTVFTGDFYDVEFYNLSEVENPIGHLADYVDVVLGEYNYYTTQNRCWATVAEAIQLKLLYYLRGRPRMMDTDALLEFVYVKYPELEDGLDTKALEDARQEFLSSDTVYPFFKVDTVNVNVYRRMTRGRNTPETYLSKNIKGLHKSKNGHLVGEENKTRILLYNTYLSLLKLWQKNIVPVLSVKDGTELTNALTSLKK